jgi:hypothetical protein
MPIVLPDDYFEPRDPGFAALVAPYANALRGVRDGLALGPGAALDGHDGERRRELGDVDGDDDVLAAERDRQRAGLDAADVDGITRDAGDTDQAIVVADTYWPPDAGLGIGPLPWDPPPAPPQPPDPDDPAGKDAIGPPILGPTGTSTGLSIATSMPTSTSTSSAAPGETIDGATGAPSPSGALSDGEGAPSSDATSAAPAADSPPAPQYVTVETLRQVLDTLEATIVVMV